MKKTFLSIFAISALLFTSCTEDRGTTSEVAENRGEVNPNHIRGYGDQPAHSSAGMEGTGDMVYMERASQISGQMTTDLQLDEQTQQQVQQVILERERRLGDLDNTYNYSETARMGGQTDNDTYSSRELNQERDMNPNTNMDPIRENNEGNVYREGSALTEEEATSMDRRASDMKSERMQIKQETEQELQAILTAEQYQAYKQNSERYGGMSKDGDKATKKSVNKAHKNNMGNNQDRQMQNQDNQ
jgi:hypothetical protein